MGKLFKFIMYLGMAVAVLISCSFGRKYLEERRLRKRYHGLED